MQEEKDTLQRIRNVIRTSLGLSESDVENMGLATNLAEDLNADSLDFLECLMAIEAEFGITIDDNEAKKMTTIQNIVDFIESQKN